MRVEIFSDLVCPWCFIGKHRFERAVAQRPSLAVQRVWRPFQLNPDLPVEGMERDAYYTWKFGGPGRARRLIDALAEAAEREGITLRLDLARRIPNTLLAHRLVRHAAPVGLADRVTERLFQGYFQEGADIGDRETLAVLGSEAGLDSAALRAYLGGEAGAAEVRQEDRMARGAGITGVPCFIFDRRYAVVGAEEPESFLPLFDAALAGGEPSLSSPT